MFYGQYGPHSLMAATEHRRAMGRTSIQVSDELADELHGRKERGDSYEDVIWRLISRADEEATADTLPEEESTEPVNSARPEPSERGGFNDPLASIDFPNSKDRDEVRETIYAARDYLREHGKASMRDFVIDVMPEHSLGYDVPDLAPGERYRGSWWRKIVKPGLEALPDVKKPGQGESEWKYTGDADE